MQFPRLIMSRTELHKECGFSMEYLLAMAHIPGQTCAFRKPGGGRKIWYNTEKLAKQMEKYPVR